MGGTEGSMVRFTCLFVLFFSSREYDGVQHQICLGQQTNIIASAGYDI